MPNLSLLIAHKHDKANDAALKVCLDCLVSNTVNDYEILVDATTPAEPYTVYNALAQKAAGEYIVFLNSDTFCAPSWDVPMMEVAAPDVIVVPVLVESGAIGVHPNNIPVNFGMTPETFKRPAFELFAEHAYPNLFNDSDGWFMPSLFNRNRFLLEGGFDTSLGGFPLDLDRKLWDKWRASGKRAVKVPSYCYHLQNYSNHDEQVKAVRHEGTH